MNRKILFIIGFLALVGLSPALAHAQTTPSDPLDDCKKSLYENNFMCQDAKVRGYCSTVALQGELPDALVSNKTALAFYKSAYCDLQRAPSALEDEILKIVADQMNVEEEGWDEELVKNVLNGIEFDSLAEYAGGSDEATIRAELPESLANAYLRVDYNKAYGTYLRVNEAYQKERVMAQAKQSLKSQFKKREIWANGSLTDISIFDLVVDLNLIEIVLFGSQAKWKDDVYKFPPKATPEAASAGEGATGQTPGPAGAPAGGGEETPQTAEGQGGPSVGTPPKTIICQSPDVSFGEGTLRPDLFGEISSECGNGKLDPKEECDDGKNISGDGCSQDCRLEPGNTLACMDPQAVSFKLFEPKTLPATPPVPKGSSSTTATPTSAQPSGPNEVPIDCPPGTVPTIDGQPLNPPIEQPATYNPNVGGTLKTYPPSERPECPPNQSSAEITFTDPTTFPPSSKTESTCVPTAACADYETFRKLLFGDDYATINENDSEEKKKEKKEKKKIADAIESFVCVRVKKEKRGESPYPLNEGCIDCHILAMNDLLGDTLSRNVACLENNMQAWGLSNRWGPNVSFNLDILVALSQKAIGESALESMQKNTPNNQVKSAKAEIEQMYQKEGRMLDPNVDQPAPTVEAEQTPQQILSRAVGVADTEAKDIRQSLAFYRATGEASAVDQKFHDPIKSLLLEMKGAFNRLQATYTGMAAALTFSKKKECTFD